ncbi:radical SAM protein [Candidatus Endoriftia persephone str. Guaymas]|jgi:radical SAM superfamily enzyme YgiQ (UPF0313 family)|uniref:Radical SAM domain protein n=3 Tax=Gammaproteobacteria TaxID=1236 RepID=G2FB56_9GAMM|nr:B12-binding domain-containing radical SAM protein [Candidatus Endoriftia persephone]EGV51074.1 radical SAM domain protein [endosymbiont of Riftia pachyptila (vent Ph05)]EGW55994.1 radical SAM domain protein [endosymbiont of Tevnia jerichonana (vent Tica)]MBA1332492.1 radical SAM protein [Candidatus Endoriftia persephone str. Guaymas]USF88122.1 B12-binding domain-containing radical SAM protein [Candidatus Endoriftia persephone]
MAKIDMLLVYPKATKDSPVNLTPLSILYPGALFESQGKRVAYFDARYDPPELLDELIGEADEIGVSCFTGYQTGQAARILKHAKRLKPGIITGVGGHHARILPEQCLSEPFVDKVWRERVYGEHLFPYNERTKHMFARGDMQYFTSRGCPFPCTFCALTSPWKPKPIDELERELKIIHHDVGFDEISFSDPNIGFGVWKDDEGRNVRMDRVRRIQEIGRLMRDLGVRWDGNIRAPYLSPEMVEALVEASCFSIEIGCESGNDHFLRKVIRKGHGVKAICEAAQNVRGSGVSIMYSFIANMPRETPAMLRDTLDLIDWIVDTDPDARVSIYNYAPYPGSPMYEDALAGVDGYPRFEPPASMEGWGRLKLMQSPIYWIAGLNFRMDNTRKNFPGDDWRLIEPYVELARDKWQRRDVAEFPCDEVERLIEAQVQKRRAGDALMLAEAGV